MPSVSGIQMSSSTRSGRISLRAERAVCGVLGEAHAVALVAQDLEEQFADADFVVDDEDLVRGHARWLLGGLRSGRTMLTLAPCGFTFSTRMRP